MDPTLWRYEDCKGIMGVPIKDYFHQHIFALNLPQYSTFPIYQDIGEWGFSILGGGDYVGDILRDPFRAAGLAQKRFRA